MSTDMIRAFLENASAKHGVTGDPYCAGEVAGLALALSCLTGESLTNLVADVAMQSQMEKDFPFELHLDVL